MDAVKNDVYRGSTTAERLFVERRFFRRDQPWRIRMTLREKLELFPKLMR